MPEIPDILRKDGYRFIKVAARDKRPVESGWNKDKNYSWDDPEIQGWISKGGNYGVLPRGGLVILDADELERLREIKLISASADEATLAIKTGGGGRHYYFKMEDSAGLPDKVIMFDLEKTGENDKPLHLGEIYIRGNIFVVGPTCIHYSGNKYEIINHSEPIEVNKEGLVNIGLKKVAWNDPNKDEQPKKPASSHDYDPSFSESLTSLLRINIGDVCSPLKCKVIGNEIVGEHPIHGSKTGTNISINTHKNTWVCRRCNSGGDPITWIAVEEGIIDCSDAHAGCLEDRDTFLQVIEALKRRGYEIPEKIRERKTYKNSIPIIDFDAQIKKEKLPSVDEFNEILYDSDYILIRGPPRKGKTYVTMLLASQSDFTINYITNRHTINGQAKKEWESIKDLYGTGKKLVWLAGKSACCPFANRKCTECSLSPSEDGLKMTDYFKEARHLLATTHVLDRDVVWAATKSFCPYHILKCAEKYAEVCLTVPYFLTSSDADKKLQYRDVVIIDEDSTVDNFYAQSIELATYTSSSSTYKYDFKYLESLVLKLENLEDFILYKEKEEGGERKKKALRQHDRIILEAINKFREINDTFSKFVTGESKFEDVAKATADFNATILLKGKEPEDNLKMKAIRKVEEYEKHYTKDDDDKSISSAFEALLFSYKDMPIGWFGKNKKTARLIGDRSKLIRDFDAGKLIVIGFTRAEQFIKDYSTINPGKTARYEITKFDYGKNYIIISIGKDETSTSQDKLMAQAIKNFMKMNHGNDKNPSLVLCSTINKQNSLSKFVSRDGVSHNVVSDTPEELEAQRKAGNMCIFYANSSTSRGVDAPNFDILFVESSSYANPYYDAMIEYYKDEKDKKKFAKAMAMRESMESDEVTNSVLRPTPIRGCGEEQSKFIFIKRKDLYKIDSVVAEDMYIVEVKDEKELLAAINIAKKCGRKIHITTQYESRGVNYEEARSEFKELMSSDMAMDETEREYLRNEIEKAKRAIYGYLKGLNGKSVSRDTILKRLENNNKIKSEKVISVAIKELYIESKITDYLKGSGAKNRRFKCRD